jgi:hypothetical protein
LMISSVAMADQIGVFTDASGSSCDLPDGFTFSATIIHKFSNGSVGSRFKVVLPPSSSFFGFNTPWNTTGSLTTGISVDYGACLTGSIVIGTMASILVPGVIEIQPADNDLGYVVSVTCSGFQRYVYPGNASVGGVPGGCYMPLPTESSTWGGVKALYR